MFEGGDGAGKTTQVTALARWLTEQGYEVVVTREPGGTAIGQSIRSVLLHDEHVSPRAEALLFAADRAHHVATVVRPALRRGAVVVADRYIDSSVAYQASGRDLSADDVLALSGWATEGLVPHLTVLLDVPVGEGRSRRGDEHDRLESEAEDFHARVRTAYLSLAAQDPSRYVVLDGTSSIEDLVTAVRGAVRDALRTLSVRREGGTV